MECRARVLYRRGRGCVADVLGAVGSARSPPGFAVLSCPGEPVLVPEGGGPPARSPHASLRLGVVDLEARPGPAAALRHPECTLARRHPPHWWRGCVVSGQALRSRQHPPHWWHGCVVGGQALPPPSDTEVVAASPVFRVPSGPPARSPSAPRACGSARRLEARPGPAVPPAPSTLRWWFMVCVARPPAVRAASLRLGASARSPARPCGPAGTLHTGGAWRVARQNRVGPGAIRIGYAHVDRLCVSG